jgi:hypothetical protein
LRFDTLNIALSYGIRPIASGIFIIDKFGHKFTTSKLYKKKKKKKETRVILKREIKGRKLLYPLLRDARNTLARILVWRMTITREFEAFCLNVG